MNNKNEIKNTLYNRKMTYKEMAIELNSTIGSIKQMIYRNFPEAKKFNEALGKRSYFKNNTYRKCNTCEEVKELNRFSGRMVVCKKCNTKKLNPRAYKPNDKRYYVYSILRDGKCIYIGKGSSDRVKVSMKSHNGNGYKILVNGIDNNKAIDIESSFITSIGLNNLENKTC